MVIGALKDFKACITTSKMGRMMHDESKEWVKTYMKLEYYDIGDLFFLGHFRRLFLSTL